MSELKPCPFCGSQNITSKDEGAYITLFTCEDCGCSLQHHSCDDHWNTRAAPKVKALEWRDATWKGVKEEATINGICEYRAFHRPNCKAYGAIVSSNNINTDKIGLTFSSMEEAKAAAQSHYEKLILEALE